MAELILRPARAGDLPEITDCWQRSFGDPPELIRALLTEAELCASATVAEADGAVRSVMFAFDGLRVGKLRASYLYALCTHPDARGRGMGRAVLCAITRQSFDRGAELVFLSPADPALEQWYRTLGMQPMCAAAAETLQLDPDGRFPCVPVGAEEYALLRRGGFGVTLQLLRAQAVLSRDCGGGFFRIDLDGAPACVCAERENGAVLIRELCCAAEDRLPALRAVAAAFHCGELRLQRQTNLVYISSDPKAVLPAPIPAFPFPLG